ncbi:MAG: LysR family transcriptional regulator [Betaproteobacteria bacterium]
MDRLHSMGVFIAVAEEESFVAAARRLNMSPPAVTRTIASLENHLGVKLLTRTTRFVRATDAGQRYQESARRILAEADEADEAAAGVHASPRGQLAVTAPVLFGCMHVMPGIVEFLTRHPEVSVNAVFLDRVVNLLEEGLDVGVRIGELPDSTMRAIPVGSVRRVICASPDYLVQHPGLNKPGDLAGQTIISASTISPGREWHLGCGKQQISIKVEPRLSVTNNAAAIEATLMGFGITRLMSYQVAAHLAAGKLVRLFPEYEPPALPIHIIHLEGRQASAKVRALVDVLVDQLRGNTALAYCG